jgi:hypothetical protein
VKKIILFSLMFLLMPSYVMAHPGNTDASGGHTCRTNCEDWGLNYGEYHYHDGSSSNDSQSDYDAGYERGYDTAYGYASKCQEYEWNWEGSQDYGDGFEDGIDTGHADGTEVCEQNSYDAGFSDANDDSENGLEYDEERNFEDTYQFDAYIEGYSDGYDEDMFSEAVAGEEASYDAQSTSVDVVSPEEEYDFYEPKKEGTNYIPYAIGGGIGVFAVGYAIRKRRKANKE